MDTDERIRTKAIADEIGYSRETVLKDLSDSRDGVGLQEMGIMDIVDPEAQIPSYTPANTSVMEFFENHSATELHEFFNNSASRKLTHFWFFEAQPDETYTMTNISEKINISVPGFKNNIQRYLDSGLVETGKRASYTTYRVNLDAEIVDTLTDLNNAVYETRMERDDELAKA